MNPGIRFGLCLLIAAASVSGPGSGSGSARGAEPGKPDVWAVVIGVDRTDDRTIPACQAATRDARAVAEWIGRTAGWGRDHVLTLEDRGTPTHGEPARTAGPLRPTRANLDWAVEGWLGHRVRPGDVAVIYFAGQATTVPPRPGSPAGRGYLLPIDAAAADVPATAWSPEDALDRSGLAARARVLVWLDTSPQGRGDGGLPRADGAATGADWLSALARWPGVSAWLAADPGRLRETGSPGPFVAALTRTLGPADQAHNVAGCLAGLRADPPLAAQGFRAVGGVDPSLSLWPSQIRPVEAAVPELVVQTGHGDRITALRTTADDALLISASQDSTVRVWNRADGTLVRVLSDPMNGVAALALNPDGTTLLAGDGMGRVVGWDLTEDRPRLVFGPPEHRDGLRDVAFLPDGKHFASLDRGGRSVLWQADRGQLRKVRELASEPLARLVAVPRPDPAGIALVATAEDGSLLGFDAGGQPHPKRLAGPGPQITALDLRADGRSVAVGDEEGRVRAIDVATAATRFGRTGPGPIHRVAFLPGPDRLVVADSSAIHLVEPRAGGSDVVLPAPASDLARVAIAPGGRWLAGCSDGNGRVFAWDLRDPNQPRPVTLEGGERGFTAITFTTAGTGLLAGDSNGSIRSWTLGDDAARPGRTIPPARGKVASLDVAADGSSILQLTRDDVALVWDLNHRRGAKPIPGRWIAGAFLPGTSALVLAAHPEQPGGPLVVFDRDAPAPRPTRFVPPLAPDGQPFDATFGAVAASRGGRWVAAASVEGQTPLACVWEAATGTLVHWTRLHDGGLTAVGFGGDDRTVLTASADGTAKLWPLDAAEVEWQRPLVTFSNPDRDEPAITAARTCPADPKRVALGTRGGKVLLWTWEPGRPGRPGVATLVADRGVDGSVNTVAFSADGRWLTAAGARDKTVRFWSLPEGGAPRAEVFRPTPHHTEQVGALAAWSDGSRIVSGGDDGAVRFWDLAGKTLVGTLLAAGRADGTVDWLATTPDGLFDGSLPGEALVRWRVGREVVALEQVQDSHFHFDLAATFARAERPHPRGDLQPTPQVRFVAPGPGRDTQRREFEVTLWTGDRDLSDLRLYQNGVPVRGREDFTVDPARPHFATTRVQLRPGDNQFHALGSRPGATDGRSDDLVVRFDGSEPPGRLHALALGVSDYRKRALKYAHADAQSLADLLHARGLPDAGPPGERIVLTDGEVTAASVREALRRIGDAVRGHPEDTVVLFLAGHTETDVANNQFCLLLAGFPFPDEGGPAPLPGALALRGNPAPAAGAARVGDPNVLAFNLIYNRLARLEALQRLVIVDACQAGAILDDPAVRRVQRMIETSSRQARNSYLLAARRGEPAAEADALRHGLLSYVLLRGLGAPNLATIPADLGGYPGPASADLNGDGVIGTEELVRYTDGTLPRLAGVFPRLVQRAGGGALTPDPNAPPPDEERRVQIQTSVRGFPLIPTPR